MAVRPGGVIVWHDYGVWPGVTQALDRFATELHLPLRRILGTTLVALRATPRLKAIDWPEDIAALLARCHRMRDVISPNDDGGEGRTSILTG